MINKDEHLRKFLSKLATTPEFRYLINLDKSSGKIELKHYKPLVKVMHLFELIEMCGKFKRKKKFLKQETIEAFIKDLSQIKELIKKYDFQNLENFCLGKKLNLNVKNNIAAFIQSEFDIYNTESDKHLISKKNINPKSKPTANISNAIHELFGSFLDKQRQEIIDITRFIIQQFGVIHPESGKINIVFNKETKSSLVNYLFQKWCFEYEINAKENNLQNQLDFIREIYKLENLFKEECLTNFTEILSAIKNDYLDNFIMHHFEIADNDTLEATDRMIKEVFKRVRAIIQCFENNDFELTYKNEEGEFKSISEITSPKIDHLINYKGGAKRLSLQQLNDIIKPYQYHINLKALNSTLQTIPLLSLQNSLKRKNAIDKIPSGESVTTCLEKIAEARDQNKEIPKKLKLCEW